MARRRGKGRQANTFGVIVDFAEAVDVVFERLTGKPIAAWLKEFQQQPRVTSGREQVAPSQSTMPLADAYAVLGLSPTASLEEVKKRYRTLANVFHPDRPGGYKEAMVLLNNAYDRIRGHRSGSH